MAISSHRVFALIAILLPAGPVAAGAQETTSPHGSLTVDLDCSACHEPEAWVPAKAELDFSHNRATGFPLLGRHAAAPCAACHFDLKFDEPKIEPFACGGCHVDVHQGKLSDDCASCHNALSFLDIASETPGIPLHTRTAFPLTGTHTQVSCETCHADDQAGAFTTLDTGCFSCHEADFAAARTVDHIASGFSTQCDDCHTTLSWQGALFDHVQASGGFDLVGAHVPLTCGSCHGPDNELLFPAPSGQDDCVACHQSDYDDQHAGSGFATTCLDCHTVDSWEGAEFDHVQASGGFDLVGAHVPLTCESCHGPDNELLFPAPSGQDDCVACHQSDYDDQHVGSGFATTCLDCHTVDTWEGAEFDHAIASDGFDLEGAHAPLTCESCHGPDNELLFPAPSGQDDCVACHQSDYDGQHVGSGFATTCRDCHTVDTWEDAEFNHLQASGGFDLVGAHALLTCESCHGSDDPSRHELLFPAPSGQDDCVACHQSDYDGQHAGTGFATTCLDCHTVDSWQGAVFDHDGQFFPIYSGKHQGRWSDCATCHTVPGDFSSFSCFNCHEHNRTDTDRDHSEVNGYVYQSTACLSCHPDGNN
jgi:hypothetical protein